MVHDDTNLTVRADAPSGRIVPTDPDALLFQAEVAYLTGLSTRTLEAARQTSSGIPFVKLGARSVRYRRRDVIDWIEARRCRSTRSTVEPCAAQPTAPQGPAAAS